MVNFHVLLAIFFLFNANHGLREWPQRSIVTSEHDVQQRLSNLDNKTRNDQESEELLKNYNSFTKLTLLENVYSNELTEPTITDITYVYKNLVLTPAITFRKETVTSDFKNTQRDEDDITGYIKGTIIEKEDAKKTYHRLQNIESEYSLEGTSTVSELDSPETTTENQFMMMTPARRIYYGHKTKIKHFPFLVTVHVFRRFVCGGSIIKSNLVITAASCFKRWQKWLHRHKKNETTIGDTTTDQTTTDVTTTDETTTDETTKHVYAKNATTDMPKKNAPEKKDTTEVPKTNAPEKKDKIEVPKTNAPDKKDTFKVPKTNAPEKTANTAGSTVTKPRTTNATKNGTGTIHNGTVTQAPADTSSSSEEVETRWKTKVTKKRKHNHTISVRVGTNYYRLDGEVMQVVKVHFHPSYQENNLQSNLAILKLKTHLIFNHRNIDDIDIRMETADVPEGTNVTIAGWGAQTYHNKIYNGLWNLIQKSVLTVISRDECIETYTSKYVDATNFCARNEHNEGACNGDAGDPAVIGGELVGVISFGSPECGAANATTVFTNLGYYTDWIEKIMADVPLSETSEEDSSYSEDTNHTKHTKHTSYTKHTKHTKQHTKHTNHTKRMNHTKHTKYTKPPKHIKHTNRTKRTEATICMRNPSRIFNSGQMYYGGECGERYTKSSSVYYSGERNRKSSSVYYSGDTYRKSSPLYHRGDRYREPSPVYYSDERYRKSSPVYYRGERYRKSSPVYYSDERYRKSSPVYHRGERYPKPSPVYFSGERYQEQMNFQQSLTQLPRGYRRIFKDKLRETFTSLFSTHSLKGKITDIEKDRGFVTISPLRPLTRSMQYTHGSGIGPDKSMPGETNARIENHFLLTPNTPRIGYDTTL